MAAPEAGPVPQEALDFFRSKSLRVGFDYRDVWRDEHARHFTVAKVTQEEVLADIKSSLERALERGETFESWMKTIRPELAKSGWWGEREVVDEGTGEIRTTDLSNPVRLRRIYDTNLRQARAAGQWERIQRTKRVLPFLLYQVGPSAQHREEHLAWHGTLLPADDSWWQTHMPMNGWGCKCHVRQVGQIEHDRLVREGLMSPMMLRDPATDRLRTMPILKDGRPTGRVEMTRRPVKTTAPPLKPRKWRNKRTGRTELVPAGIDPGFDINAGSGRDEVIRGLEQRRAELRATLQKPLPTKPARPKLDSLDDWVVAGEDILASIDREIEGGVEPQSAILKLLERQRPISQAVKLTSRGVAATRIKRVSQWLPDDWTKASDEGGPLSAAIKGARSYYRNKPLRAGELSLGLRAGDDVALHELGHRIQHVLPGLDRLFQEIHKRRTAGAPVEVLYALAPRETGRPDGYVSRYQGREYFHSNENGSALEVLTMALQYTLGGNPMHFAELRRKDSEMLKLMLSTLWHF